MSEDGVRETATAVILTALPVEDSAVRAHLSDPRGQPRPMARSTRPYWRRWPLQIMSDLADTLRRLAERVVPAAALEERTGHSCTKREPQPVVT